MGGFLKQAGVGMLCGAIVLLAAEPGEARGDRFAVGFSTYFGGSHDEEARAIRLTPDGALLIGGQTHSADLPTTAGVIQAAYAGEPAGKGHPGVFGGDLFLLRLSGDGSKVEAATYLGGSRQERNTYGFELAADGNLLVSSITRSHDFPVTAGASQTRYGGGASDSVVAKVSPDLRRLIWSTYLGGDGEDWARGGIALTGEGDVILVGRTDSSNVPARGSGYAKPGKGWDAHILQLSADGGKVAWVSRFGGSGNDTIIGAAVGVGGRFHFHGHTWSDDLPTTEHAFQRKPAGGVDTFAGALNRDGSLLYLTRLGGQANEFAEHRPLAGDDGSVVVVGVTLSADFPVSDKAAQTTRRGRTAGFLTQLSADGSKVTWSTFLGGTGSQMILHPARDGSGNILFVGSTSSTDFPVTADAVQTAYRGGPRDGVFGIISADGSRLLYATYIGGSGDDMVRGLEIGSDGAVYLVGKTSSTDFHTTPKAASPRQSGGFDAFVMKLVPK